MSAAPTLAEAAALLAVEPALGGCVLLDGDGWAWEPWAALPAAARGPDAPVLRLPVGVDADHLLGGLDLESSLAGGRRVLRPGLLAGADGGVLWIPAAELVDPALIGPLAAALRAGAVVVERDGVSACLPARLLLLTAAPWAEATDGAARGPEARLLACAGLWLGRQAGGPDEAPDGDAAAAWLAGAAAARARLPLVEITSEQIAALAAAALRLGIAGQRVDYWASRAARAAAALAGRTQVETADLERAVALVLAPRATRLPEPAPPPAPPPPREADSSRDEAAAPAEEAHAAESAPGAEDAERLIAAEAAYLPPDLAARPAGRRRGAASAGSGRGGGARMLLPARHGRAGPPMPAPRRPPGATLDLAATIAAALQRPVLPPRAARTDARDAAVRLRTADLRWRRPQAPPGVLFLLVVDASGSMARNRLGPAKGAALLLLDRAYRHRDRVALIAARGAAARLLLPPTRSVTRARRLLDRLPAGGGTPLASALALAREVAGRAAGSGYPHTLLVLLTDGRGNVPLAGDATPEAIAAELAALAAGWAALAAAGQAAGLVVDTRLRFLGASPAQDLATALGGRYLYLPQATPDTIGGAAEQTAAGLGWRI